MPWLQHPVAGRAVNRRKYLLCPEPDATKHVGPDDLPNRQSTGIPQKHRPLLIGLGKTGRPAATFKIKTQNILEVVMSSRNEHARAQAQVRLQQETPITDDASLLPLQEEAAAIVREAKRRDPSGTDELVSTVLDEVARSYFRHALRHR